MANRPQPDGRTPRHFHSRGKRSPLSEHDDARIENIRWRSGSTPRKTNARGLACPFLKAFPNTPQWNLNGTCARHSWPSIPRLKEHLYRCHAQNSLSCPRCVASFEKPADLDDHLRSAEPCKVANRKDSVQQTINSMQIDRLRKRKGTYGQNDIQKWYEIWDILFPDRQRPSSPYADLQDGLWKWDVHHILKKNFQSFIEKRLPQTVADNLRKDSIVSEPGSSQNDRIKELISRCLSTTIQEYESESSEHSEVDDQPPHPRTSTESLRTIKADTLSKSGRFGEAGTEDQELTQPWSLSSSTVSTCLSKASSDSSCSSGDPLSIPTFTSDVDISMDMAVAGIGSFWESPIDSMTKVHSNCWSAPDNFLHDTGPIGIDTVLDPTSMPSVCSKCWPMSEENWDMSSLQFSAGSTSSTDDYDSPGFNVARTTASSYDFLDL